MLLEIHHVHYSRVFLFTKTILTDGYKSNEGASAASFCCQVVVAWFPDLFGSFNLVKNHKIA
jgi:hypothetical protein